MAEQEKVCNGVLCQGRPRPRSAFTLNRSKRDGLQSQCKACHNEARARKRAEQGASKIRGRPPAPPTLALLRQLDPELAARIAAHMKQRALAGHLRSMVTVLAWDREARELEREEREAERERGWEQG